MLKPYGTRAKIVRMTSEAGSKKFKNESLDFVFIDVTPNIKYNRIRWKIWNCFNTLTIINTHIT